MFIHEERWQRINMGTVKTREERAAAFWAASVVLELAMKRYLRSSRRFLRLAQVERWAAVEAGLVVAHDATETWGIA